MSLGTLKKQIYEQSKRLSELQAQVRNLRCRCDVSGKAVIESDLEIIDTVTISVKEVCFLYLREYRFNVLLNLKTKEHYVEAKRRFVSMQDFISPTAMINDLIGTRQDISDYLDESGSSFVSLLSFKIKDGRGTKKYCLGYINRGGHCPILSLNHSDSMLYTELTKHNAFEIICTIAHSQRTFWKVAEDMRRIDSYDYEGLLNYSLYRARQ